MESKIERKEVRSSYEESHTAQANPQSGFVKGIYSATQFFVGIFQGIFSLGTAKGVETTAIFEPGTLIAMIILAIIAWVVLKLVKPRDSNRIEKTDYKANE